MTTKHSQFSEHTFKYVLVFFQGVCTEAGMYALRERRVHVTQEDFEMAVAKVCCFTWILVERSDFFPQPSVPPMYIILNIHVTLH